MKKLISLFAALLLGCSAFTLPAAVQEPPVARDASGAVLDAVVALVDVDGRPFCTGSYVGDKVLTAAHCVRNESGDVEATILVSNQEFATFDGYFTQSRAFTVRKYSEEQDLAVLDMNADQKALSHSSLALAAEAPVYGQTVIAVGHPLGLTYTMTSGIVSHPRRMWQSDRGMQVVVQTDVKVYFGNSGGPLLNRDAELVGVCSFLVGRQAHLGFFTHLDEVRAILAP